MIHSSQAQRIVVGQPSEVHAAIASLVALLWAGRTHVVADSGLHRVDTVTVDWGSDEPDVWLTWDLAPAADTTHVRLTLDEVDQGPDAAEAATDVLELLRDRLIDAQPSDVGTLETSPSAGTHGAVAETQCSEQEAASSQEAEPDS